MDYMAFVEAHRATGADITVSALPMDNERASDFGLMKVRDDRAPMLAGCLPSDRPLD